MREATVRAGNRRMADAMALGQGALEKTLGRKLLEFQKARAW